MLREVAEHVESINGTTSPVKTYQVDLKVDADIHKLREQIEKELGSIDVLIHSAGLFYMGKVEQASAQCFDEHYLVNVRALLLTQAMLPMIRSRAGQVVFINSSVGSRQRPRSVNMPRPSMR